MAPAFRINIDFQQLVDNSLNAILIVDQDKTIVYCNKSGLELLNLTIDDLLNKNICCFLPPFSQNLCEELLRGVFDKKETIMPKEIQIEKNGGEIVDVEVMGIPYLVEKNVFAQLIMRDITSKKIAQKLLSDREKLASLGQFAAGIIHEVKNPLTVVKGFLQLLKASNPHFYLDTMESELDKAFETLQNLLQVSKPDLRDEPFIPIDVSKELNSILLLFQQKVISFEVEIRDSGTTIVGRKNSLIKSFFNLIKNAVESIEGTGIIRIEHFSQDGWLYINVSDTGVGIPQDKLKMLGTPFFSTKTDGTGLGLTQIYTTVHEHGGMILVDSVVGKGTTFRIQLPVRNMSTNNT